MSATQCPCVRRSCLLSLLLLLLLLLLLPVSLLLLPVSPGSPAGAQSLWRSLPSLLLPPPTPPFTCSMSWMHPLYTPFPDADIERLGFHLWGYRDVAYASKGKALSPPTVALFVPGTGGSYQQMRTVASQVQEVAANPHSVLWLGLDFGGALSSLHASHVWQQAEAVRILLRREHLSSLQEGRPRLLLLVGHSAGGLAAKVALHLFHEEDQGAVAHQQEGLRVVLVTLASPLMQSPVPMGVSLRWLYSSVRNWRDLSEVGHTQISISGGSGDELVAPALTFSPTDLHIDTGSYPGMGVTMDHKCIVWCREVSGTLAHILALALRQWEIVKSASTDALPLAMRSHIQSRQRHHWRLGTMPVQEHDQNQDMSSSYPAEEVVPVSASECTWESDFVKAPTPVRISLNPSQCGRFLEVRTARHKHRGLPTQQPSFSLPLSVSDRQSKTIRSLGSLPLVDLGPLLSESTLADDKVAGFGTPLQRAGIPTLFGALDLGQLQEDFSRKDIVVETTKDFMAEVPFFFMQVRLHEKPMPRHEIPLGGTVLLSGESTKGWSLQTIQVNLSPLQSLLGVPSVLLRRIPFSVPKDQRHPLGQEMSAIALQAMCVQYLPTVGEEGVEVNGQQMPPVTHSWIVLPTERQSEKSLPFHGPFAFGSTWSLHSGGGQCVLTVLSHAGTFQDHPVEVSTSVDFLRSIHMVLLRCAGTVVSVTVIVTCMFHCWTVLSLQLDASFRQRRTFWALVSTTLLAVVLCWQELFLRLFLSLIFVFGVLWPTLAWLCSWHRTVIQRLGNCFAPFLGLITGWYYLVPNTIRFLLWTTVTLLLQNYVHPILVVALQWTVTTGSRRNPRRTALWSRDSLASSGHILFLVCILVAMPSLVADRFHTIESLAFSFMAGLPSAGFYGVVVERIRTLCHLSAVLFLTLSVHHCQLAVMVAASLTALALITRQHAGPSSRGTNRVSSSSSISSAVQGKELSPFAAPVLDPEEPSPDGPPKSHSVPMDSGKRVSSALRPDHKRSHHVNSSSPR